jgi:hypothetical protein
VHRHGQWLADTGTAWIDLNAAPQLLSSLPGSPYDGQEIYYSADPTNGVIWHFRYRSASGSIYKWERVGGPQLFANVLTAESTASAAYVDLTTVGPSITAPLAGEYEASIHAAMSTAGSSSGWVSVQFGSTAAVDDNAAQAPSNIIGSGSRIVKGTVATAGQAIKLVYRTSGTSTVFQRRMLSVCPTRVG